MIDTVETIADVSRPATPREVQEFASARGIDGYLEAVIDLARESFPSSALCVSLGQDAEDETHQYIALDVDVSGLASDELLNGQQRWSAGIQRVCPSRY